MGKALYEGILVDVPFAPFFMSKWLGRSSGCKNQISTDRHGRTDVERA